MSCLPISDLPMDLSIVSEHKLCVLRGFGQRPNKHETGGFRVNGIRLFSQSGYRFALLAAFLPPFVTPLKPWFSMPHIA